MPSDYGEEDESEEENSSHHDSSSSCSSASKYESASSSSNHESCSSSSSVQHESRIKRSDNAYQINMLSSSNNDVKPNSTVFEYKRDDNKNNV
ncbi:MAG: hypothetical protein ACMG6E_05400 [Candidatus Roizmanbacteria bacterium]